MDATILLRLGRDASSRYALVLDDGKPVGDFNRLKDAVAARDYLQTHDLTCSEARALLQVVLGEVITRRRARPGPGA
jgi:hypothetical protein